MKEFDKKSHWENIYSTKQLSEVSWYQPTPNESIDLIEKYAGSKNDSIIDVGGGDSFLVDHLLNLGYTNITVLDISEQAIERAKTRLGINANLIKWIITDITDFKATETYDIWHDRAAFHFLTDEADINTYKLSCNNALNKNGHLILGTFAINGPLKCSGIEITQYDDQKMKETFIPYTLLDAFQMKHPTPFDTEQLFQFAVFKK